MKNTSMLTAVLMIFFLFLIVNNTLAAPDSTSDKFDIENAGILSGQIVLEDGTPLAPGYVAFFKKDNNLKEHQDYGISKRSPTMVAFLNSKDGKFTTMLFPAGSYFIGAVQSEKWIGGPPQKDQKKFSAVDKDGNYLFFEVKAAETVDIGKVTVSVPADFPARKDLFTVIGRVLDPDGQGIPDSVVVAKTEINNPRGDFISAQTDADGNYQLKITPGLYFFVARKTLTMAGRPKPGGLMGTLGQDKPLGIGGKSEQPPAYIVGKDGDTFKDVNITMFKVPIPDVKRREIEAQVKAKKIDKSSLPENLPLMKQKADEAVPSEHKPE
jgi:hypothetical protein